MNLGVHLAKCYAAPEKFLKSPAPEELFDISELQLNIGRPAMVALTGARRRLHLPQQRIHFGR